MASPEKMKTPEKKKTSLYERINQSGDKFLHWMGDHTLSLLSWFTTPAGAWQMTLMLMGHSMMDPKGDLRTWNTELKEIQKKEDAKLKAKLKKK